MSARSTLLAIATSTLPNTETTVYTSPAAIVTLVKAITLDNSSGGTVLTNVRWKSASHALVRRNWSLATNTSDLWLPWLVLEPGDKILLTPNTTGAIRYTIHGAQLSE